MADYVEFDPDGDVATALVGAVRAGEPFDCHGAEVPADWLRGLIAGTIEPDVHAKGVRLSNATITGQLDLEAVIIGHGVRLEECRFDDSLNLVGARLREMYLTGSVLPGIQAEALTLDRHLWLDKATMTGQININRARIAGEFSANEAELNGGDQGAVWGQGAEITGGMFLDKATVTGQIDINSARIAGQFVANGAELNGGDREAVWGQGAEITGGMFLKKATVTGQIDINSARMGGPFSAIEAELNGGDQRAVWAQGAEITGGMFLDKATVTGQIAINGARIGGQFSAIEAELNGGDQRAVWGQGAEITGGMLLKKATVTGQIAINGARIGGQFSAIEAELNGGDQRAVWGQGAEITGDMFLDKATVTGQIDINSARIAGQFFANGAELNGGDQEAVWGQGAEITGGMFLTKATVTGQIDINGARIGGPFSAIEAELNGGDRGAVWGQGAEITGGMFLTKATVTGQIAINGARIGGPFFANEAEVNGGDRGAVWGQGAEITGGIVLTKANVTGTIDINDSTTSYLTVAGATLKATGSVLYAAHASVGRLVWTPTLVDGVVDVCDCAVGTWVLRPASVCTGTDQWRITGFTYRRTESLGGLWDIKSRVRWLDTARDDRSPGPYQQMAALLRREGHDSSARQVLIAGNRRLEHGARGWVHRILFGWTIGYGYRPWRVLLYLTPVFVALATFVALAPDNTAAGAWIVTSATDDDITAGNDCDGHGPCLQPVVYALDTILPVIDFGQAEQWTVNRNAPWAWTLAALVWLAIATGWLFGILLAAAAGGLVRQT